MIKELWGLFSLHTIIIVWFEQMVQMWLGVGFGVVIVTDVLKKLRYRVY